MKKSRFVTVEFFGETILHLTNISSLTMMNVGTSVVTFRGRELQQGEQFLMDGDGTASDIDIEFDFDNTGTNHLLMDYRVVQDC